MYPHLRCWYVPHQVVINTNIGKTLIVFDCSSQYIRTLINEKLLSGPDLTSQLVGILRFRVRSVSLMADIQAMFYQVKVPEKQRSFL